MDNYAYNMERMKICVVPDVHARNFWKEINVDDYDKIVFLGDYIDPYRNEYQEDSSKLYDNPTECLLEVIYLKKENPDKVVLLLGNHDCHYIWDSFSRSSRYNKFKARQYEDIFYDNLDLFQLAYTCNNVVFTHAGITESWLKRYQTNFKKDLNILELAKTLENIPISKINNSHIILLSDVPYERGGWCESGSCLWAALLNHFKAKDPVKYDCFQIFGHTQLKKEIITDSWACLDCRKYFTFDTKDHSIC